MGFSYIGSGSHVHQFWLSSATTWSSADLTASTGALSPKPGSALSGFFDTGANTPRINYIGGDSHVHRFWLSSVTAWSDADLTASIAALGPAPGTALSGLFDTGASTPRALGAA